MTPLSNWNYVATGRVDWQQSLCDVSAMMRLCENNLRDGDELTRHIRSRSYCSGRRRVQGRGAQEEKGGSFQSEAAQVGTLYAYYRLRNHYRCVSEPYLWILSILRIAA